MAKTKYKKKRRFEVAIVSICFAIIMATILISYVSILGKKRSPLPFEEVYLYSKQLSRAIYLIDKSMSDGFYTLGMPEENVVFLSVLPRQKDRYRWNFSSIEVRIPSKHSLFKAGEEIKGRISQLPLSTQVTVDKKTDHEIIYSVYYKSLYTHKLKIMLEDKKIFHPYQHPKIGIIIDNYHKNNYVYQGWS